ncbi:putative Ig domain-containing protein [Dactylosporangium siamense]|uniref:F5/8 type C domain-containing protein n=1 Tax=Dactylosporangium siamense TaxID=685454 RepID=A0A919Q1D4_9ACTN|nr:putative Ig domain-containing protein [Dactylosporangium siamense]GIG53106.1 hypothetical protein Dsi01nite_111470 [Dactylosporangium siamense]
MRTYPKSLSRILALLLVPVAVATAPRAASATATPAGVSAVARDGQTVTVTWTGPAEASGYQVLRDGEVVARTSGSTHEFVDRQLDGEHAYAYQIRAVDAGGVESTPSAKVTTTTPALPSAPVNYARCGADSGPGCSYTVTHAADAAYPDAGGRSLTDGRHGPLSYGSAWQGRNGVGDYSFTVDLGEVRPVAEISTGWLQVVSDYVQLPANVTYAVSSDGQDFEQVASIDRPAVSTALQAKRYRAVDLNSTARYVRVHVAGGGAWTMTDEIEIRGPADVVPPPTTVWAAARDAQTVVVLWFGVVGMAGFEILRDGDVVARTAGDAHEFLDRQLDPERAYSYQVRAIDTSGARSQLSPEWTATTPPLPAASVNYARCGADSGPGCSYTTTQPADAAYPDAGGRSLTDGEHAPMWYGPAWQGRNGGGAYAFTVDLGESRPITEINTTWFQVVSDYVQLPANVTYSVGTDGEHFQQVASIDRPAVSTALQARAYRAIDLTSTARYVRVDVTGGGAWTMTDEIEIRGPSPSEVEPPVESIGWLRLGNPGNQVTQIGAPVSLQPTAESEHGIVQWSASNLPAGLQIDPATGKITGVATVDQYYPVVLSVLDAQNRSQSVAFDWKVLLPMSVGGLEDRHDANGGPLTTRPWATGGEFPYTWDITGLPDGVVLTDPDTGDMSGVATTPSTYRVTATVTDPNGLKASASFVWTVGVKVDQVEPAPGTVGEPLSQKLTATGGRGTYAWSATGLPPGLSINAATGEIRGAPTAAGARAVTVTATDEVGNNHSRTVDWQIIAAPPTTPDISTGDVSTFAANLELRRNSGIAIADGGAYVMSGRFLTRVDLATRRTTRLAGNDNDWNVRICGPTTNGSDVAFGGSERILGTDGTYIYLLTNESRCPVVRIDIRSGATNGLWIRGYSDVPYYPGSPIDGKIAGHFLYLIRPEREGTNPTLLVQYDLRTGNTRTITDKYFGDSTTHWFSGSGDDSLMSWDIDGQYAWHVSRLGQEKAEDDSPVYHTMVLRRVELATGNIVVINKKVLSSEVLPSATSWDKRAGKVLSVGNYLYATRRDPNWPNTAVTLLRISKLSGAIEVVAGGRTAGTVDALGPAAQFTDIRGIATDGRSLFLQDTPETGASRIRMIGWGDAIPQFDFALPPSISADVVFAPNKNTPIPEYNGPILVWDEATGLCIAYCAAIHEWRQQMYENDGDYTWWHVFRCADECMPEDYEKDLIAKVVEHQQVFNLDGTLRADFVVDKFLMDCWASAAQPSTDCNYVDAVEAADKADYFTDIAVEVGAYLVGRRGGQRPELNEQQKAAKETLENLAARACRDAPRGATETMQDWGKRVHQRFDELVKGLNDPKVAGETGYLDEQVVGTLVGSAKPLNSTWPDAVYGVGGVKRPEMIFDLKTGFKGIAGKWVTKLTVNLPAGFKNIPVFRLGC